MASTGDLSTVLNVPESLVKKSSKVLKTSTAWSVFLFPALFDIFDKSEIYNFHCSRKCDNCSGEGSLYTLWRFVIQNQIQARLIRFDEVYALGFFGKNQ